MQAFSEKLLASKDNKSVPLVLPHKFLCVSNARIIMDSCDTGRELSQAVKDKLDGMVPWQAASTAEVQTAVQKSGVDAGVVSQFDSLWLVGQKENTGNAGIESAGLCTLQVQMSGGKLMITVSASEIMNHFQTRSVKTAVERLAAIDCVNELPDAWVAPSLSAEYIRTGDIVYVPAGFVSIDKAVSDSSMTLRRAREIVYSCLFSVCFQSFQLSVSSVGSSVESFVSFQFQ